MLPPSELARDVEAQLLRERVIVVGALDMAGAQDVAAKLLLLERRDPQAELSLYVNSDGGAFEPTLVVYDAMQAVSCPVATLCLGVAADGAVLICCAGSPGRRAALPNSRFVLRQPPVDVAALGLDAATIAAETSSARRTFAEVVARHSGADADALEGELRRGVFLAARAALDRGLVDSIVEEPPKGFRGLIA